MSSRPNLTDMPMIKVSLPPAPVPIRVDDPETQQNLAPALPVSSVFAPPSKNREPTVYFSCRIPIHLRKMLDDLADKDNYDTTITAIVLDLLETHLPNIPPKPKK